MTSDRLNEHKFWSHQPVFEMESKIEEEVNEPMDKNSENSEISQTPITLPPGFEWCSIDIRDPLILREFFEFLEENYIEDSSSTFKLEYSEDVIRWALVQSGYFPECIRCIRFNRTGKLIASIVATPDNLNIGGKKLKVVFVDFLCIAKEFRSKRLSPVLIKEITRLSNLRGIFQALHTGAIVLPTCVASPAYFHRFLNPKKLLTSGFSTLPDNMKLSLYCKIHKTPSKLSTPGFREMKISDVKHVTKLLNDYQQKFRLAKIFKKV
uniref:Glycylpeptide N-tetradecanoyltransferase n=1 Tax=Myxobolus squamalis TaxID=59785 RepID=A0A6B2G5K1_MYXSQ